MIQAEKNKNFLLIGAAGYVAPKHLKAIKETGNRIIGALDKSDSVGILDSFSHDVAFFTEFERFDRYAEKLKRNFPKKRTDFVSICSPNYLHDAHIRFALRIGADAICEKPLVLNPWNLDALADIERETGKNVYNVLQLRSHPSILKLKNKISSNLLEQKHEITLTYITSRGNWYFNSWKGVPEKSGGIATNIGIHFFDMLIWIFGEVQYSEVHIAEDKKTSGYIELKRGIVKWFLSVDKKDLPVKTTQKHLSTFRSVIVDEKEIEFSDGFSDLHTLVYRDILNGKGCGIEEARPSINLVSQLRAQPICISNKENFHPMAFKN